MENKRLSLKEIGIKKLLILFLAGVILIAFSVSDIFSTSDEENGDKSTVKADDQINGSVMSVSNDSSYSYYENELEDILGCIRGIGKVRVMITYLDKGEKNVITNSNTVKEKLSETDSDGGTREDINESIQEEVQLMNSENANEIPYVKKETLPSVAGVFVVAQGAGDGRIVEGIVNAIEALFNVPIHKIQVMEME